MNRGPNKPRNKSESVWPDIPGGGKRECKGPAAGAHGSHRVSSGRGRGQVRRQARSQLPSGPGWTL